MMRRMAATLAASLLLAPLAGAAEDAKAKPPLGTWVRKVGDNSVRFKITKDKLHATIRHGDAGFELEATYEVDKDGVLKGKITKVEKKGTDGGPSEGEMFSFKFKLDGDAMTVSEVKGNDGQEVGGDAKELVEGEYKKEKKE